MKGDVPLDNRALHRSNYALHLGDRRIVSGDHYDRNSKMAGNRGIQTALRHLFTVESNTGESGTRHSMGAHSLGVGRAGVIADKERGVERGVDPLHHHEWTGP